MAFVLAVCAASWLGLGEAGAGEESPPIETLPGAASHEPGDLAREAPIVVEPEEQVIRVGVNDRVTMHVKDLPLADAMRMLSEPTKRNIILANGVTGTVSGTLHNATFAEALEAMLVSNGLGYREDGNFIYVYPLAELAKMRAAQRQFETRVFRLAYMTAQTAKDLIEPLLSKEGKISITPPATRGLGGDSGPKDTEGDSLATADTLLISDYVDRLEQIERLIHRLDDQPKQVLVEATLLRASLNEDNALGIDFTTVGGIDFSTLESVSPAAQSITTGDIPNAELQNTTFTARTNLNSGVPAGGFTFGIIKDQVGVFIRALEQITDTEILANPKILALNKQTGQVIVGRRDGYLTTTFTETQAIQTVEFLETGTILTFRPYIGDDGNVRLELHPKDSTGGLTSANLPFEQTTEVTTNILVRDGHTVLIGGLFREVNTSTRGQMPVLGNIPIAGALFRNTRDNTVREEVIILLTVHIVKNEAFSSASRELYEDVERFRVGMRRGMQWLGSERLAQSHFRWAMDHLAKGDVSKALWDAEMAVNCYPRHVDATKLREKLRGQRSWESEASAIRTFVNDRILEESGLIRPPFQRPGPPFTLPEGLEGPNGLEEDEDGIEKAASADESPIAGVETYRSGDLEGATK